MLNGNNGDASEKGRDKTSLGLKKKEGIHKERQKSENVPPKENEDLLKCSKPISFNIQKG